MGNKNQSNVPMSTNKMRAVNKIVYIAVPCVVLVGVYFLWPSKPSSTPQNAAPAQYELTERQTNSQGATESAPKTKTVGSEWQPKAKTTVQSDNKDVTPGEKAEDSEEELTQPIDMAVIYDGLQEVKISESGEIIIDDSALKSLNRALNRHDLLLSESDLVLIKDIISESLPSPAGEQTAQLVENYYEYVQAHKEFTELHKDTGVLLDHATHMQEVANLRELYLGKEVADELFAEQNKTVNHMLEMMSVDKRQDLSDEEKKKLKEELTAEYNKKDKPEIYDWDNRYADYNAQKQQIL